MRRILLVVLPRSPHSARLANLLVEGGWEVHVASAYCSDLLPEFSPQIVVHQAPTDTPVGRLRKRIRDRAHLAAARTAYRATAVARATAGLNLDPGPLAIRPLRGGAVLKLDDLSLGALINSVVPGASERVFWLADLIDTLRPDVIHSFTIQQASYLTLAAKTLCRRPFPTWIVGNWGIDIHFFRRAELHRRGIEAVLAHCDYYTAECHRDVRLAREHGFAGQVLGVAPIGGGFEIARLRALRKPGPTSRRRFIMVKGYQNLVGRALVALRAIALCADVLAGYRVALYLADADTRLAAELLESDTGVPVEILPYLPHDDLMRYHGAARVSIGLSLSDAISTSALEAMIMGSFPIQSHTSCLDEWIRDSVTGILVHPEEPAEVAEALRRALTDDQLVDAAVTENDRTVEERLDAAVVNSAVLAMYERLTDELHLR